MKTLFYLCLLIFALASCEAESVDPALNSPETIIFIRPQEELKDGERYLKLLSHTEKIYPCMNFGLTIDKTISSESFKITFTGVQEEDICATALGPATKEIDLGNIPNGDYYIELNNGSAKNMGVLSLTSKTIQLVFARENGIEVLIPQLHRVPAHTYWGIMGYHNQDAASHVQEFRTELEALGATFAPQTPGNYGHYQINAEGEMEVSKDNGYYFASPFIFQYLQDEAVLKAFIQSFGEQHKDKVYLYFNSYKGEQISGRAR